MAAGKAIATFVFDSKEAEAAVLRMMELMKKMGSETNRNRGPVTGLGKETVALGQANAQANMFMQQFAFTLSDAPYFLTNFRMGVMSVANNVQFLVSQFGQMRTSMTGNQTVMQALLATLKGPAGLVLGFSATIAVVQALSMAFDDNKEKAEEANKALGQMRGLLVGGRTEAELKDLKAAVDLRLKGIQAEKEANLERYSFATAQGGIITSTRVKNEELNKTLEAREARLTEIQTLVKEEYDQTVEVNALRREALGIQEQERTRLMEIDEALDRYRALQSAGLLIAKDGKVIAEEIEALEKERTTLLETQADRTKRTKEEETKRTAELEKQNRLLDEQANLEAARVAKVAAAAKETAKGYDLLYAIIREGELAALDDIARQEAEEADRHQQNMADIDELAARGLEAADIEAARQGERARNQAELDRLRKERAEKGSRERARTYQDEMGDLAELRGAINAAFGGFAPETFLGKLRQITDGILQIVQALKAVEAAKAAGTLTSLGSIVSGLGILGGVFSVFGALFDKGGYTGDRPASEPVGVVHGGEFVFEKPLVDRHYDFLSGLRGAMQNGYARGGFVGDHGAVSWLMQHPVPLRGYAAGGIVTPALEEEAGAGALLLELRTLTAAVTGMQIQQPIVFRNVLDSQRLVREELPDAQDFIRRKQL